MEGVYEICFGQEPVGKVQVQRSGLYYRFQCRCRYSSQEVYRLMVSVGNERLSIGVPVPYREGFLLDKQLAVRKFPVGKPEFYLAPMHETVMGKFVPISPEEPFNYISQLKDAFLTMRNGQLGVMIPEKVGRE